MGYWSIGILSLMQLKSTASNRSLKIPQPRSYNCIEHLLEWVALNENQILTSRQTKFKTRRTGLSKIGTNALANIFLM